MVEVNETNKLTFSVRRSTSGLVYIACINGKETVNASSFTELMNKLDSDNKDVYAKISMRF